jgi:hypothetical protein
MNSCEDSAALQQPQQEQFQQQVFTFAHAVARNGSRIGGATPGRVPAKVWCMQDLDCKAAATLLRVFQQVACPFLCRCS